jgi:hypothetical protein
MTCSVEGAPEPSHRRPRNPPTLEAHWQPRNPSAAKGQRVCDMEFAVDMPRRYRPDLLDERYRL